MTEAALDLDLFWSFRSPYSYLAMPRLVELARDYAMEVHVRPVYPIAVRIPGFFKSVNPLWPPYVMRDTQRLAAFLDIPYQWPQPDPIVMDMASGEVPKAQPYIHRLTRLGTLAAERGRGLPFIAEVGHLLFGSGIAGWHEGDHLAAAVGRAGLDLAEMDTVIVAEEARLEEAIAANETAQKKAGHWGVPLMVFRGEPFFGQDRIELLLWRMRQAGLQPREAAPVT
ncbi:2-hydroxychromene-2-carboxylate isomerase [Marinibaculum pumilum]|uniref:2-hydroxychromene-2-carboxylate isomerase n=1 Tax=Marinibaculum pumilum TaxID=1766165 RepID=A0ABV7L6D8_9PROT